MMGTVRTAPMTDPEPKPEDIGKNLFAVIMDEHNFDCKGPGCDVMVYRGGKLVVCSRFDEE